MNKRMLIGIAVVGYAFFQALHSMSVKIEHLENWDGIYAPSLWAPFVDSFASSIAAFIAGQVLPSFKTGD